MTLKELYKRSCFIWEQGIVVKNIAYFTARYRRNNNGTSCRKIW